MKKKGWLKKLVVAGVLLAIVAGGALWWIAGNVDRLVKQAIERYGSEMLGAKVSVESVDIRASGEGVVKGLLIGNPSGFKTPHAAKVGQFEIAVDRASVLSDVIRIRRIAVARPDVIYERGDGMTNIDALERNVKAYLGPSSGPSKGPKLIVDQLLITSPSVQVSAAFLDGRTIPVSLPGMTLQDIGKAKGGVPPGELGLAVTEALKKRLTAAVSFDRLAATFKGAVGGAVDTVKGLFK